MAKIENENCRRVYGELFDALSALLFRHDPIGINFDTNTDEYDPETRTILPRLEQCRSESDVLATVLEEFHHWFGEDFREQYANYKQIAVEVWQLWENRSEVS